MFLIPGSALVDRCGQTDGFVETAAGGLPDFEMPRETLLMQMPRIITDGSPIILLANLALQRAP